MSEETAEALGVAEAPHIFQMYGKYVSLDGISVLDFELEHDVIGHRGFSLLGHREQLVYITDTMYCKYQFPGMTHLMIECNYIKEILDENTKAGRVNLDLRNRIVKSHMSLETAKDLLRANDLNRLQEIHLLHLSDANSDEERMKREIQELTGVPVYVA